MPKTHTFQIVKTLPVTTQWFTQEFFYKDDSFQHNYHDKRGDKEVVIQPWVNDQRSSVYKPNVKIMGSMKISVTANESQKRSFDGKVFTLEDVVTTDTMGVKSETKCHWKVEDADESSCRVTIDAEVTVSGNWLLVTEDVRKNATTEVKTSQETFLELAMDHIAQVKGLPSTSVVPTTKTAATDSSTAAAAAILSSPTPPTSPLQTTRYGDSAPSVSAVAPSAAAVSLSLSTKILIGLGLTLPIFLSWFLFFTLTAVSHAKQVTPLSASQQFVDSWALQSDRDRSEVFSEVSRVMNIMVTLRGLERTLSGLEQTQVAQTRQLELLRDQMQKLSGEPSPVSSK